MKYLYIICSIFLLPVVTSAAGIEVSPAKLNLDAKTAKAELIVANPTADVQIFHIYADDFEERIKLSPQSFTLESGARKVVVVTIIEPSENLKQTGVFATNISIIGKPLAEGTFSVATGVKIPITINPGSVDKATDYSKAVWFGTFVIMLIAAVTYSNRKPKI
jgi:hypothetical protein